MARSIPCCDNLSICSIELSHLLGKLVGDERLQVLLGQNFINNLTNSRAVSDVYCIHLRET